MLWTQREDDPDTNAVAPAHASGQFSIQLVPYSTWGNRRPRRAMRVWLPYQLTKCTERTCGTAPRRGVVVASAARGRALARRLAFLG